MEKSKLTFGQALEAAKEGYLIAREGWNGKDMFVFVRPSDNLEIDTIVQKVKSIPSAVKSYFAQKTKRDEEGNRVDLDGSTQIHFTEYLCMKSADNSIVNGWLASQTDMLSNDWYVLPIEP